jgi:hypothetical protein
MRRHCGAGSDALENQRRQLIKRVSGLQSEQNKSCNHHVEAEMHEALATNCLLWRVDRRLGCEPNSTRNGKHDRPENTPARRTESFRRRGRDAFVATLFDRRSLVRRQLPACSRAVENPDSPQHDDDGRYQGGRRQYTFFGSDSHTTLRFPAPPVV